LTPSPSPSITPTPTNLIPNYTFNDLQNNFPVGWSSNNPALVIIDTSTQGGGLDPANSIKITASSTQNTLISPRINLPQSLGNYLLSYFARTSPFQSGGIAVWINEYDQSDNWLGGQWLGGRYSSVNQRLNLPYTPRSSTVSSVDLHLFTEEGSNLTLYLDDITLSKQ
jgi:hypothetical protein